MADPTPLIPPKVAPMLNIPESMSTVDVRIIDTTSYGSTEPSVLFSPPIPGLDKFNFPSYSFLITHHGQGKHVLFDLGMRKDWASTLAPSDLNFIHKHMPFRIERNVEDILDADPGELNITSKSISSIIWSHPHFDHRGNITSFPPTTELILGPGTLKAFTPTYPTDPNSSILASELANRPITELNALQHLTHRIGAFAAHDLFDDGSFYLLSTPGHTVGHLSGLARVTPSPSASYVLMGGDCAHHPAIFRPSPYLPIPVSLPGIPDSVLLRRIHPCPGQLLIDHAHPRHSATAPFIKASEGANDDQDLAEESVLGMQEFDACADVLVCIAHDAGLLANLPFYPHTLNAWRARGCKESLTWWFTREFDVGSAGSEE